MAEEEVAAPSPVSSDQKRKIDESEPETAKNVVSSLLPDAKTEISDSATAPNQENWNSSSVEVQNAIQKAQEIAARLSNTADVKRPRLDEQTVSHAIVIDQQEEPPTGNSQYRSAGDSQQPTVALFQQGDLSLGDQEPKLEPQIVSRRIEVPNRKVGVLIGRAGDTIRYLQYNSGTKIQITRDADANPCSSTRPVELIGTLENINKAEQLIKDVIAEADAGGSPALVARGFGTAQTGGEQIQIQVPNEKVGLIIGKGGETIRNLQTRTGARIQLIPQHLPEGDASEERTVRVTGNKKQIETAREMIKEVMNQPIRSSLNPGGYYQQSYRPRGSSGPPQWRDRAPPPQLAAGYDYQPRPQAPQFPPQTYTSYPQQQAPTSTSNSGWDQRPQAPMQAPSPQSGGYDYYGQGSNVADAHALGPTPAQPPAAALAPGPAPVNYNYGQSQGPPDYGQPTSYSQSLPPQHSYGHQGYNDPSYEKEEPPQQAYGGTHSSLQHGSFGQSINSQPGYAQPVSSQPAGFAQQGSSTIPGYPQQDAALSEYTQEVYGKPSPGSAPQPYMPRNSGQPGDVPYQGPAGPASSQSYGSSMPSQQPHPYSSSGPSHQSYPPYGPASGANDGYPQTQQPSSGGYSQYSSSQPGYGEQQPTQNNVNYGYQLLADTGYSSQQTSSYSGPMSSYGGPPGTYGGPTSAQGGYGQPASNPSSYKQSVPRPGYGTVGGAPPVGYNKSLSPQPGYNQYDSSQMYGHH